MRAGIHIELTRDRTEQNRIKWNGNRRQFKVAHHPGEWCEDYHRSVLKVVRILKLLEKPSYEAMDEYYQNRIKRPTMHTNSRWK